MHEVFHRLSRRLAELTKSITGRSDSIPSATTGSEFDGPFGHLDQESLFDYTLSAPGSFAFSYVADGVSHYSLGRKNWAPITIATLLLASGQDDAELALENDLLSHIGLASTDQRYLTWRDANDVVFDKLKSPDMHFNEPAFDTDAQFDSKMFTYLSPTIVSHDWLGVSNAHYRYQMHPLFEELHTISQYALGQFMQWLFDWYQSRGIEVDQNEGLVRLTGYQPMFMVVKKVTNEV
jgi:hypothetical protein